MNLTVDEVLAAADRLVSAFAASDTGRYFDCFSDDATFMFHTDPRPRLTVADYRADWASWLAAGWRVVECRSADRLVQLTGDVAVFSHLVTTTAGEGGDLATTLERETIVFARTEDGLRAVHEHLSAV